MNLITRRKFLRDVPYLLGIAGLGLPAFGQQIHHVHKGDTLSEIALNYGVPVKDIMQANNLQSDLIRIGQRLIIPGGSRYLDGVKKVTGEINPNLRKWKFIVGHHSGIKHGNADSYDKYHRRRGMQNGLAYHFVIGNGIDSKDGEIEIGPRWHNQIDGGHVRSNLYNKHGIGICLVGNFEETRPTFRQLAAFTELVAYLGYQMLSSHFKFTVHKEVDLNHTVCPGRYFPLAAMHQKFN